MASKGKGYGYVEEKGFVSFSGAFEDGHWKSIDIQPYDSEEMIAKAPFATTPVVVQWKLSGTWGIRTLVRSMSVGNNAELDSEWDASQRSFAAGVAAEEDHKDPAHRAAAGRIRTALLSGAGTSQTILELDGEFEFGKQQLVLAEEKALAADLKLTDLGPKLDRIREATLALGEGIGRVPGKNRAPARWLRIREALQECVGVFTSIHDGLEWAIAHSPAGPERDTLEKMLEPFQALLERYPAPAAAEAKTAPAPVPVPAPAPAPAATVPDVKDAPGTKIS
jgi:hypothetical protein